MKRSLRPILNAAGCILAVGLVLAACSTAPVTGRNQVMLVSGAQETQLGLSSFDQLKKETPISKDPAANALLQKVGRKIAAAASGDLPGAQWEFVVFESKEANAFCLPGGKVGVYTGLLPITQNEDGLAVVIGHEVAHAAAHHGAERMSQELAVQTGGQLAAATLSTKDPKWQAAFNSAFPALSKVGILLPYSRLQESEADRIGLTYMLRAGYNPDSAVAFWRRFAAYNAQGGAATPAFLRTHPTDETRIRQIQAWLPEVKAQATPAAR